MNKIQDNLKRIIIHMAQVFSSPSIFSYSHNLNVISIDVHTKKDHRSQITTPNKER